MSNPRILKKITVVDTSGNVLLKNKGRFKDKTFRSYRAVAKLLVPGEYVTVRVCEYMAHTDPLEILAGYGEVGRHDDKSYYEPRRLDFDY